MSNFLNKTILTTVLLTTLSQANAYQLVPLGFDFEADDAKKAAVSQAKTDSAWSSLKSGGWKLGSALLDLGYGLANTGYSALMGAKGLGEMAFGAGEVVYGAAHNAYGTLYNKDEEFFENGKSWQNAGFKNVTYGFGDLVEGVKNVPNTANYFINGIPKIVDSGFDIYSGMNNYFSK